MAPDGIHKGRLRAPWAQRALTAPVSLELDFSIHSLVLEVRDARAALESYDYKESFE